MSKVKMTLKRYIFNIPVFKPILAILMVVTFINPYLDLVNPIYESIRDFTKYRILKKSPPGIVGHSYLSGEYMRAMQDSLSDSLNYRNGTGAPGDDWMDMVFFNYRNLLLKSLGYLDYQSPVLTELLSSNVDDLSELDQGNTFEKINSHFLGFFDKKDRSLSDLYQAAYFMEGAANALAYVDDESKADSRGYYISLAEQFKDDAFGYYTRAKYTSRYWLPPLHLTVCKNDVTYRELRFDQNSLKEFLKVEDDKPSINGEVSDQTKKKIWRDKIVCEAHTKLTQPTDEAVAG